MSGWSDLVSREGKALLTYLKSVVEAALGGGLPRYERTELTLKDLDKDKVCAAASKELDRRIEETNGSVPPAYAGALMGEMSNELRVCRDVARQLKGHRQRLCDAIAALYDMKTRLEGAGKSDG
jgi:hypothetical protein